LRFLILSLCLVFAVACVLIGAQPATAGDIFVDPAFGSDVVGDGSAGNPYLTLGTAIGSASSNDTIWAAAGVYFEDIDLDKQIGVIGVDDGVCIIQGSGTGSVVTFGPFADGAELRDFTVTGGFATHGGGIRCEPGSSPTIRDCTVTGNTATADGGGIYCAAGSSPTIEDCTISFNSATRAAIFCGVSSPTITGCISH
jgi:parallel beta-helix repeat protein